jgi:hypothetical protein
MHCLVELSIQPSLPRPPSLSSRPLYESNNSTQKIQTSGRKVFRLSMNFGYHLAVGPHFGSIVLKMQ